MERPPQHVTETESIKIFDQAIPSEWVNRTINLDYGLDKSVEVVENGKLTGKELLVQLKGTDNINITDGRVNYPLEVKNLKYYLQRDLPVVLTVVDITSRKCYWLFIQQYIYEVLDESNSNWTSQGTVTIKIPVSNEITSTIPQLKDVAFGGSTYLLSKKLDKIPIEYLEHWESNSEAISKLVRVADKLLQKQFQINLEVSYRLQKENEYEKSRQVLMELAEQAKSKDTPTYIKAILAVAYQLNPFDKSKEIFQLLESIKEPVENSGIMAFQIMWWADFLETLFAKLIKDLNSTRMMHLVSTQSPTDSMTPFLNVEIGKIIYGLYQVENDFIPWLEKAYQNREFFVYLDLLRRLAKMQFLWCYNNALDANPSVTYSQIKTIEKTLHLADQLATTISQDLKIEVNIDLAILYNSIEAIELRDKYLTNALEMARRLCHKGFQYGVQHAQESYKKAYSIPTIIKTKNAPKQKHQITDEEEEEMLKHLLEIGGIDINSNDELAELAKVGLRDRNPERILKHCENLHTEIVIYGPIWDMMALPSTGTKILFCEKNGVAIIGHQLDMLLEGMKEKHCAFCNDLCSRPANWKWTHEWHKERKQPEKMQMIIKNFLKS